MSKTIKNYVKSKIVTRDELKQNFTLKKKLSIEHGNLDKCVNCGSQHTISSMDSEPWTSAQHCWNCNTITIMSHADHMSGNHESDFEVYGNMIERKEK